MMCNKKEDSDSGMSQVAIYRNWQGYIKDGVILIYTHTKKGQGSEQIMQGSCPAAPIDSKKRVQNHKT